MSRPKRVLAVDVGTGTQDILLFESGKTIENCFKMVMPSSTVIVAERIKRASERGQPLLLTGVTMGGGPSHWAARDHALAGHAVAVVVPIAWTALTIDDVQCLLHLSHMLAGTGIQRLLHDRLLRTSAPSERSLQGCITAQTRIDLDQAMGSRQHADEGIVDLVDRCVLDCLLINTHALAKWAKQIELTQLDADCRQTGTRRKMTRRFRVVDSFMMMVLLSQRCVSAIDMFHHRSSQVPFFQRHCAAILAEI